MDALCAYSFAFENATKIERDLRRLAETDHINQIKKHFCGLPSAYDQIIEITRQQNEIKNLMKLAEPAQAFEDYEFLKCVDARDTLKEIIATERRANFASLYGLQNASESMRALQTPSLTEKLILEARNQRLQQPSEITGASLRLGINAEIAQILDARKTLAKQAEAPSGASAAKHALKEIQMSALQQFNDIAGISLQARVVTELNLMGKQYEPFADLARDWSKSRDYSNLTGALDPLHQYDSLRAYVPYTFDQILDLIRATTAYDYARAAPATNTKKAPVTTRSSRPYLANRRMYDVTANVSGVLEAALREAMNSELDGYLGTDWIEVSGFVNVDKIKSMKELQAKDAKDGDIVPLYEYFTLGEVCALAKRKDLWKPVMSKLFVAKRQKVLEVLDQLFKPRNVSTHRRSCLTQSRIEQAFINARFVANALQDEELLGAIDEYELEFESLTESQTIH